MSVAQVPVVVIVLGISPPLVGRLRFQYPAGISCSDRIVGNTLSYHAASAKMTLLPIWTPGSITALAPIHTLSPMVMSSPLS